MLVLRARFWLAVAALLALAPQAFAQKDAKPGPDPVALLEAAKNATGGKAWDGFFSQRSTVRLATGGMAGDVERWVDIRTGRSMLRFAVGPMKGTQGYDGKVAWVQDGDSPARREISTVAQELAVNAAYRDRLAFWFPERAKAAIEFKEHATIGVQGYEVVRIVPAGGRPFEFWINSDSKVIERLVEPEASVTRVETFGDFRMVQGVQIPFRVRAQRGPDVRTEEIVNLREMEFNLPLEGVDFSVPASAAADWTFPEGKKSVEVPFELHNGHLYVQVRLDGKGPFRMLFDTGAISVLVPEVANALELAPEGRVPGEGQAKEEPGPVNARTLELGGIVLKDPFFAVMPLRQYGRRIEGFEMDGLVGFDLLKRFPTRIDYEAQRVTFYDPASFRYEGRATPVPFRFRGHIPQIDGTLDGIPAAFDLDTGARSSLTLLGPYWRAHKLDAKYGAKQEVIAGFGLGGPARALVTRAGSVRIAGTEIKAPVTMLSTAAEGGFTEEGTAGSIGYGLLRRFNLVFDYPHEQLFLEPNAALGSPDVYDRSGLWIERSDRGFELVEVVPGGAAAAAGIKAGDVVVAVDGTPVADVRLDALRDRLRGAPGTKIRLKLGDGRERVVTLKDIV